MTTSPPAIQARGLAKSYRGRPALVDLDLEIPVGQTVALLGANGAGKSTTVELLAGLRRPDAGEVRILGLDPWRERAAVRQVLGVQLQHAELHGALKVGELVDLYRSFYPDPRSAEAVLALVELEEERRLVFDHLSGGQAQRLSVALALVGRPRVLFLDELTTGLDPAARRRIRAAVRDLKAEGLTILFVSHAMEEVEELCDRVVLLSKGRIIADDTPEGIRRLAGAETLDDAFVTLTGESLEEAA